MLFCFWRFVCVVCFVLSLVVVGCAVLVVLFVLCLLAIQVYTDKVSIV